MNSQFCQESGSVMAGVRQQMESATEAIADMSKLVERWVDRVGTSWKAEDLLSELKRMNTSARNALSLVDQAGAERSKQDAE